MTKNKFINLFKDAVKHIDFWVAIAVYPIMAIILLLMTNNQVYTTILITFLIVAIFIAIIAFIWQILKRHKIHGPLLSCVIMLIITLVAFLFQQSKFANLTYVISIVFLEIYILIHIFSRLQNSRNNKVVSIIILGCFFVTIGVIVIYDMTYTLPEKDLFMALMTVFAGIIGGLLTLGGVAWTIVNQDEKQQKAEIAKAKPYFVVNRRATNKINFETDKVCFPVESEEKMASDVYCEIENSKLSVLKLSRIYREGQWLELECNNIILPNGKCILNFRFNDDMNHIYLETKDIFEHCYYYQLKVLLVKMNSQPDLSFFTVREFCEIDQYELLEMVESLMTKETENPQMKN